MLPEDHLAAARRIEASMQRCEPDDHEMLIEGAMLAGSHRLNALLHQLGTTPPQGDVMHTYLLTVNEFDRLHLAEPAAMEALRQIEKLRPAWVRGNHPGGREAGARAGALLEAIRQRCGVTP
jgi:hypothetical protein